MFTNRYKKNNLNFFENTSLLLKNLFISLGLFTLCVLPDNVDEREEYIAIVDDDSNPLEELEDILT